MGNEVGLIVSLVAGYALGKSASTPQATDTSHLMEVQQLQSAVNKALLDAIAYENAIKNLQAQIDNQVTSGPTVDFLKLQLEDLQENYDLLMDYTRSKVGELPTSFTVAETPVNGLHFSPLEFFDRNKPDRNLKIVDGVLTVNGVANFKVPVYALQGGQINELKTAFNPTTDAFLANIGTTNLGFQLRVGNTEKYWELNTSATDQYLEPLVLVEFDKSVDLRAILNNIVWGAAKHNGGRWDIVINGGISLYRRNILAFKMFGMAGYNKPYMMNLVLKTLTGSQQMMINSVAVVDSCHSSGKMYQASIDGHNYMVESYKLIGKAKPFE